VKKDVLLFENTSSLFFYLNYLIPAQLAFWLGITYQYMKTVLVLPPEYLKVFNLIDLNDPRWKYGIAGAFIFTGIEAFLILVILYEWMSVESTVLQQPSRR